jgi:hypothetical protein
MSFSMNRRWRALGVAAALGIGMPAAARAACRVVGQEELALADGKIVIHPRAQSPFEVSVYAGTARVTLGSRGAVVPLEVEGTLSFKAEARGLRYSVKTEYGTPDGMVRLLPGAHFIGLRARGDDAVGAVVMTADDYLPGDDKPPDEVIEAVPVPCAALTLDQVDRDFDLDLRRTFGLGTDGTWWDVKGAHDTVELRSQPRESAPKRTVTNRVNADGHFAWGRLESRGEWVKVARLGENLALVGWIRRSALERTEYEGGRSGGCYGRHGPGLFRRAPQPPATKYEGPAHVAIGTTVFADRDRGPWATVRTDELFKVRWDEGVPWARLTEIPGVGGFELSAYVPASSITPAPSGNQKTSGADAGAR